jgi:hypothetical protein
MTNVRNPIAGVARASLKLLTLPLATLPGSAARVDEGEDTSEPAACGSWLWRSGAPPNAPTSTPSGCTTSTWSA